VSVCNYPKIIIIIIITIIIIHQRPVQGRNYNILVQGAARAKALPCCRASHSLTETEFFSENAKNLLTALLYGQ